MDVESFFELEENDTDVRTELLAGVTTFLTISYIIVVNPTILSQAISIEGFSQTEVFQMIAVVTIISSVVAMIVMGVYANLPFALAPGIGLNAFFAFTVVLGLGVRWQTALAAVFVEGLIFVALTITGARSYVISIFPKPVKLAVGSGIGAFLLMIGLQEMEVVINDPSNLVTLGNIASNPVAMLGLFGTVIIFILWARDVTGEIIIGIGLSTLAGYLLTLAGVVEPGIVVNDGVLNTVSEGGILTLLASTQFDISPLAGAFIQGFTNIEVGTFLMVVLTFFFVDFFDTAGALIGLGQYGGYLNEEEELPEMDKALLADGVGTTVGGMLGTSTISTYIQSSTGIEEGGRTGLTVLTTAGLFILSIPLISIITAIPTYASFSALVVVGIMMFEGVTDIDWEDPTWAIPAGLTIIVMPITYSIADGIAAGIIIYPVIKSFTDGYDSVTAGQWSMAVVLATYYLLQTGNFAI
jgi:AGZA family xanthine/uracil permease-like MFS transporter